jgi:hypothetical protein
MGRNGTKPPLKRFISDLARHGEGGVEEIQYPYPELSWSAAVSEIVAFRVTDQKKFKKIVQDWKDRGGAPEQKGGAPHAEQKYKTELRQLMQSSFTKLEGAKWFGEGTVFTVRTLKTAGKNFVIPPLG